MQRIILWIIVSAVLLLGLVAIGRPAKAQNPNPHVPVCHDEYICIPPDYGCRWVTICN